MKKMLLCLVLMLPIVTLVPNPANAAAPSVKISPATVFAQVLPCRASAANSFTVSGQGFESDEKISLSVGGVSHGGFTADHTGKYSATAAVRPLPSGNYSVLLVGDRGNAAATVVYIGWSGCRAASDGVLAIGGAGFAAKSEVDVLVDGKVVDTAVTSPRGRFEIALGCDPGQHTAKVSGAGGRTLTFASFAC